MNLELPRPTKGQLFLLWAAGLAAITLTASGEYALYVACGFGPGWSAAGPVCIDAYVMAAIHARREVPFAVMVMVGTNATAHLLPEAGPPVPVVVAVSALAPVVLWRVHALAAGSVRLADGTVAQQATVGGPVAWDADALDGEAGPWSAPWDAEPWPPTVGQAPTVAALAPVGLTGAVAPAVVGQQPTTTVVAQAATQVVTDEGVSTATDAPAGDHGGYQGGDQPEARGPVMPVVTEVVTTAVAEHDVSSPEPVGSGDQPDDRGTGAEVVTGVVTRAVVEAEGHARAVTPAGDQPDDQAAAEVVTTAEIASPFGGPANITADDVSTAHLTEAEVRRAARALNRRTVKATGRPVTIAALQAEFGLSRRAAADLRRYLIDTTP